MKRATEAAARQSANTDGAYVTSSGQCEGTQC